MQEIVINHCFGGFGLSHEAIMAYAQEKGITLYPVSDGWYTHYYTDAEHKDYFSPADIQRDDSALLKVVKDLGKEAWGNSAELGIIEIPDGVNWTIEEYDGQETIAEIHRTWS